MFVAIMKGVIICGAEMLRIAIKIGTNTIKIPQVCTWDRQKKTPNYFFLVEKRETIWR